MITIEAIFQDGVFRPLEHVDLPDQAKVQFEPRLMTEMPPGDAKREAARKRVWELLAEEFDGEPDLAARHNEHQP